MPQDYKSIAQATIGRYTYKLTGLDTKTLGRDLARQIFSSMLLASQVLDLLKEEDKVYTGYYIIRDMPDANLKMLSLYKEGQALLQGVYNLLKGYNPFWGDDKDGFALAKNRISDVSRQKVKLTNYDPRAYRKLFDFEMPANGKKEICWELPVEGDGFTTYKRNDENADGLDQIGTYQTIQAILTIAKAMRGKGCPILEIGDISRAGGLDTSAHTTHEDGKAFDMRLLRNDGKTSGERGFTWRDVPPYHRDWTKAVILTVKNLYSGSIIYFNDEEILKDSNFNSFVIFDAGHNDHLHIILPGGERDTENENKR